MLKKSFKNERKYPQNPRNQSKPVKITRKTNKKYLVKTLNIK